MVSYSYELNALVCDKCHMAVEVGHVTNPETLAIIAQQRQQGHICTSKRRKRMTKPVSTPVQDDVWGSLYRRAVALYPELANAAA
jgi:hypothetical protein